MKRQEHQSLRVRLAVAELLEERTHRPADVT